MSRIVTDPDLRTWEVYSTTGPFGLPQQPKIVFNCLSDHGRRARYIEADGDIADAQQRIQELGARELAEMLGRAEEFT